MCAAQNFHETTEFYQEQREGSGANDLTKLTSKESFKELILGC